MSAVERFLDEYGLSFHHRMLIRFCLALYDSGGCGL